MSGGLHEAPAVAAEVAAIRSERATAAGRRSRRVAILASEFPPGPGGIGTHAYHVARGLAAHGWEVLVAARQAYATGDEVDAFNALQPFRVASVPGGGGLARVRALFGPVAQFRPDLVLASGRRFTWAGSAIARLVRRPFVAVGHGTEFGGSGRHGALLTRLAFGGAACVVSVSDFTRGRMLAFGVRPRRDVVIANGADGTAFGRVSDDDVRRYRAESGLGDSRVLLTIGNVTERKGQEVVIRALPEIVRRHPRTLYVMAGLPTLREPLAELACELGVETHVRFAGTIGADELRLLANACDLFVMSSRRTDRGEVEGFGIAVIEAALCGRPAVVSDGSGLVEAVESGLTGLVVPENDPAATAAAIVALLDDDGRRIAMGDAAHARARAEYTWERKAERYDELLRELVVV